MSETKISSLDIKTALAKKHRSEFFITECKTGPTQCAIDLYKFDGIAIYKSWSKPRIVGYEIKVSRSDFLSDSKFFNYLPYCHELYFVVPTGLIDRLEIPTDIGLIYYNPANGNLVTKKKAIYRNININADMLLYIFMNRVDSERAPFASDRAEYYQKWLDNKISTKELGYNVRNKLVSEIERLEEDIKRNSIRDYEKEIESVDKLLSKYGFYYSYNNRAEQLEKLIALNYPKGLDDLQNQLSNAIQTIDTIRKQSKGESNEKN